MFFILFYKYIQWKLSAVVTLSLSETKVKMTSTLNCDQN